MPLTKVAVPMGRTMQHAAQRPLFEPRDRARLRKKRDDPVAFRVFAVERLLTYLKNRALPLATPRWNRHPTNTKLYGRIEYLMVTAVALAWYLDLDPDDVSHPLNLRGTYRNEAVGAAYLRRDAVRNPKFLDAARRFMAALFECFEAVHLGYDGDRFADTQLREVVKRKLLTALRDMAYEVEYLQSDFEAYAVRIEREYWGIR